MSRFVYAVGLGLVCLIVTPSFGQKPRARDLGLKPGVFAPGKLNAITDIAGVKVGQVTLIEGNNIRTGVTAILPHGGNLFQDKVAGGAFVGNASGKLAGSTQVNELGQIETPIVLTNTLSVGTAVEAVVSYTLSVPGNERVMSVNAVVGETNDWYLNERGPAPSHSTGKVVSAPHRVYCRKSSVDSRSVCWSRQIMVEFSPWAARRLGRKRAGMPITRMMRINRAPDQATAPA